MLSPKAFRQLVFALTIQRGIKLPQRTIPSLSLVNQVHVTCEQEATEYTLLGRNDKSLKLPKAVPL